MRRGLATVLGASLLLAPTATAAAAHRQSADRIRRSWRVDLRAPAPLHYELAEVSFSPRSAADARVLIDGPIGADYIASARVRTSTRKIRVLVFILDRATALMDPARVSLSFRLSGVAPAPGVLEAPEGFPASASMVTPALCQPSRDSSPLSESDLRSTSAAGTPLPGYSAAGAISQAYDATCALSYQAAFEQAVKGTPVPAPPPPTPSPPVGQPPPGCTPCTAPPEYACPLLATPSVCVASTTARRTTQPAH
jgi:hypothetical protein